MNMVTVLELKLKTCREEIEARQIESEVYKHFLARINSGEITEACPAPIWDKDIIQEGIVNAYNDSGILRPNLIAAIKYYRSVTSRDLRDSKNYCEALFVKHFGLKPWRIV